MDRQVTRTNRSATRTSGTFASGGVARECVEGKRRRHYGPFATLAVIVGVTALEINVSGFQVLAHDWLPARPADLLQRHFNLLLLAQLPLLGGVCALMFRRALLTLPEHMVLVAYALSMRAAVVALSVPVAYLTAITAPGTWQVFGFGSPGTSTSAGRPATE